LVVEKIGSFFSKIMKESIDATFGMLADTLKFKRWERQLSLIDKVEKIIKAKEFSEKMRAISPKLALPIFQYASLEEDESLHDVWANILVTALDPSSQIPRSAFIDIIRQLEPINVKILSLIYNSYLTQLQEKKERNEESLERQRDCFFRGSDRMFRIKEEILREEYGDNYDEKRLKKDHSNKWKNFEDFSRKKIAEKPPTVFQISQRHVMEELNINFDTYRTSVDNLIRERLISSYTEEGSIPVKNEYESEDDYAAVTYDYGYSKVCITALGVFFIKACTVMD
jgi:hypothetical protein